MNAVPPAWRRRAPTIVLIVSLVLNAFLVGMIVADALRPDMPRGDRMAGFELRRLSQHLPAEAVERVEADLEPMRPDLATRIDRLRAIRREINLIAAEPQPDRARIDERLAALRAEAAGLQETVQRATYDALLKLPPELRAPLAEDKAAD